MKAIETALMDSPARAAIQRRFEAERLLAMGGRIRGRRALQVGCGRGVGDLTAISVPGARFIADPLWRRLPEHPQEDRFDAARFEKGLGEAGLRVVSARTLWDRFGWFVADREAA
jgi:hypothetical protein